MSIDDSKAIDFQRAKDLLEKAVTHKGPDFIYSAPDDGDGSCMYFEYDFVLNEQEQVQQVRPTPSCLIGHMIDDLGLSDKFDHEGNEYEGASAANVLTRLGLRLSNKAANFIDQAQSEQDSNTPWGEAVRIAEARVAISNSSDDPIDHPHLRTETNGG